MWMYLVLMLLLAISSAHRGRNKIKFYFSVIVLTSIIGLKNATIGNDTSNYIEFFSRLQNMPSLIDSSSRFEKGYQIYTKIIGSVFDSYQSLFIITAIICMVCIGFGIIKTSKNWQYSLFMFIGLRFFYFFLSGLRQSLAVSIIYVSYVFLKEKKKWYFIGLVLLASTFHFSALIFLLAWPVSKMKLKKMAILYVLISIAVVYLAFGPLLNTALGYLPVYYSHYLLTEAASANNIANYINAIIPCLFIIVAKSTGYYSNFKISNTGLEQKKILSDIDTQILFFVIAAGLSLVATRASILDRMVQYYWIFSIASVPNIIFSIKDDRERMSWYLIITGCVIVYNITILILRPEWNMVIPYRFFWQ